ncbi:MAG TPA: PIN domain-containing protein [Rhodopila sp.]|jgi:PIN domain nuclease of toxin-antitoxin system|nr:PIN domain-containing protein [Rhodopila sp.]
MSLLLDTHYVYAIAGSETSLSRAEMDFLAGYPQRFVVSAVSVWEIRLKWSALHPGGARKGPLDPALAVEVLRRQAIDFLDLTPRHAATRLIDAIPHHDPFDELLLVQAQYEDLRLLTRDRLLVGHPMAVAVPQG